MSVLITGGAGFVGYHLARHLAENGYRVDLVDNFARGVRDGDLDRLAASPRVRLVDVDLRQAGALSGTGTGYRTIFHLAAIVGVAHVLERPDEVLRDNVAMLIETLDCARRQTALDRFVFASTSEVYAGTLEHFGLPLPTPETTPLTVPDLARPRTSYMLSKLYGEALCHHAGIPFTILRPHNVYGPRMGLSHVVPELLQRAHEARDVLEVFSINHRRTFCFVDDAVEVLMRAAETPACAGETLNLGSDGPEVAIGELAELIVNVVGKRLRIAAGPDTAGSPERRCPDLHRTTELTGYHPRTTLRDGILETYTWYRANVFASGGVHAR